MTPPAFGFVGIDGGGRELPTVLPTPFRKFYALRNHQQIWPVEIARGASTPDAIVAASFTHHGRLPLRSVLSESTGGGVTGGVLPV